MSPNKAKIKVQLIKSGIACVAAQKASIRGLGLRKIGQIRELENTSSVRGMIKKIIHMLKVIE